MSKEIKKSIQTLKAAFDKGDGYKEAWQANIAMAHKDCEHWYREKTGKKYLNREDKHIIANNAADRFIDLLTRNSS